MNLLEMKDKRAILLDEAKKLVDTAKKEFRKLNEVEDKTLNDTITGIDALDKEIKSVEEADKKETTKVEIKENRNKNMENFNLLRAIRNASNGAPQNEADLRVINLGREEFRLSGQATKGLALPMFEEQRASIQANGSADTVGGYIVAADKWNLLGALRENLVAVKAGAQYLTGLVGDVSLPVYSGTTVAWKGEISASAAGEGTFSEVTLSPKRLTAYIDVSNQFLLQDGVNAQQLLMEDMVQAIRVKLEGAMFAASTAAGAPTTLFTTVNDISGSISGSNWNKMLQFEKKVDTSNALVGNLGYITNATGKYLLKTTGTSATYDVNKLMAGDTCMGYPVFVTNNVPDTINSSQTGVIFGNWGDLIIGQWGGLDVIVDPLTQAANGCTRLLINAYFDFTKRRSVSFSAGSIIA